MEAAHPTPRYNRVPSDALTPRVRSGNERQSSKNGASPQTAESNRSPANVPRGLESMLKTSTETGDIGMFSFKPSRVPHGHATPRRMPGRHQDTSQKPRQAFQPYNVPAIDDRRRLPSYARDATSEVVSMYETASQKSGRRTFDDPDYRSLSMTQISCSAYTLSNHRSYASLRSQLDNSGPLQRPRSPFAYPARLKRPGFRPSSPALTDGGLIDYSRRAEIDRNGFGHSTSSPSSLYAQKRRPPLSLRPEGNRSTPSLLGQPSPPRRSSSPYVPQSNGSVRSEGLRRNGPPSGNSSPARSIFSLASTVNLNATVPAPSTASTPGKLVPPSPLYYDYTEDFCVADNQSRSPVDLPPQFNNVSAPVEVKVLGLKGPFISVQEAQEVANRRNSAKTPNTVPALIREVSPSKKSKNPDQNQRPLRDNNTTPNENTLPKPDRKGFRLSGSGAGARELNDHVQEAFGLLPSPSFELSLQQNNVCNVQTDQDASQNDKQAHNRDFSFDLISDAVKLPLPRNGPAEVHTLALFDGSLPRDSKSTGKVQGDNQAILILESKVGHPEHQQQQRHSIDETSQICDLFPTSIPRTRVRSSGFSSIDAGLTELEDLVRNMDNGTVPTHSDLLPPGRTPMTSPTLPDESAFNKKPASERSISPITHPRLVASEGSVESDIVQKRHNPLNTKRVVDLPPIPDDECSAIFNFGVQNFRNLEPHSESPMLAPKPISPARQLKLKNSIPQLMKALPPLPPLPQLHVVHPPLRQPSPEFDLPYRFSSPPSGNRSPRIEEPRSSMEPSLKLLKARTSGYPRDRTQVTEFEVLHSENVASAVSPAKMKLRMKHGNDRSGTPPPASRPWNMYENYPWSEQQPDINKPKVTQEKTHRTPKHPKFKLKITRATNSTDGTVRVTRGSVDSTRSGGLHLLNPKDLFTPSGLDNIFRQVSRQIHSRNSSVLSSGDTSFSNRRAQPSLLRNQVDEDDQPLPLTPTNALGIFETRSEFSDDSSQVQRHHGLRKRLSNFRARIAAPYASKTAALSYDDISWRDRNAPETLESPAARSVPNLNSSRADAEAIPLRRLAGKVNGHHLKGKMRAWIRGARSRFAARMKSRGPTKSRSNDTLLPTHDS